MKLSQVFKFSLYGIIVLLATDNVLFGAQGTKIISNYLGSGLSYITNEYSSLGEGAQQVGISASSFYSAKNGNWLPYPVDNRNYLRGDGFLGGTLYDEQNTAYYVNPAGTSSFNKITGAAPTASNDLTTKAYVDAASVSGAGESTGGATCYYSSFNGVVKGFIKMPGVYGASNIYCTDNGTDICPSYSPGSQCKNGTIYAYYQNGYHYMITPSGCDNNSTPFCSGQANDFVFFQYSTESVNRGATSSSDGLTNTNLLAAVVPAGKYPAAEYCANLNYGGFTDWFLPSNTEWSTYIGPNAGLFNFETSKVYWSSTEYTIGSQHASICTISSSSSISCSTGMGPSLEKDSSYRVRCIRRI